MRPWAHQNMATKGYFLQFTRVTRSSTRKHSNVITFQVRNQSPILCLYATTSWLFIYFTNKQCHLSSGVLDNSGQTSSHFSITSEKKCKEIFAVGFCARTSQLWFESCTFQEIGGHHFNTKIRSLMGNGSEEWRYLSNFEWLRWSECECTNSANGIFTFGWSGAIASECFLQQR